MTLQLRGDLAGGRGELAAAAELWEEGIALGRKVGDLQAMTLTLLNFARLKIETGEIERGSGLIQEALQISWGIRDLIDVAICFAELTLLLSRSGDTRRAATFWGAAERLDAELGPTQFRGAKPSFQAEMSPAVLADEEGLAAGRALETAEAVALALSTP